MRKYEGNKKTLRCDLILIVKECAQRMIDHENRKISCRGATTKANNSPIDNTTPYGTKPYL